MLLRIREAAVIVALLISPQAYAEREGIARARELLDHSSDRQTETYVRSKRPEKIRPLR